MCLIVRALRVLVIVVFLYIKMTGVGQNVFNCEGPYIENIYFFEVNTKYSSSSVLKTSKLSRVCSTSENYDAFNI